MGLILSRLPSSRSQCPRTFIRFLASHVVMPVQCGIIPWSVIVTMMFPYSQGCTCLYFQLPPANATGDHRTDDHWVDMPPPVVNSAAQGQPLAFRDAPVGPARALPEEESPHRVPVPNGLTDAVVLRQLATRYLHEPDPRVATILTEQGHDCVKVVISLEIDRSGELSGVAVSQDEFAIRQNQVAVYQDEVAIRQNQVAIHPDEVAIRQNQVGIHQDEVGIRQNQVGIHQDEVGIRQNQVGIRQNHVTIRQNQVGIRQDEVGIR